MGWISFDSSKHTGEDRSFPPSSRNLLGKEMLEAGGTYMNKKTLIIGGGCEELKTPLADESGETIFCFYLHPHCSPVLYTRVPSSQDCLFHIYRGLLESGENVENLTPPVCYIASA